MPDWAESTLGHHLLRITKKPNGEVDTWSTCCLDEIYHICHWEDAKRIIEDGAIEPYDSVADGVPPFTRPGTKVVWLTPNLWQKPGYHHVYGSIRFVLDWPGLVEDRSLYWLSAVPQRWSAYRVMVAEGAPPDHATVVNYPWPTPKPVGPLWQEASTGNWYRKDTHAEVVCDFAIPLDSVKRIDFVRHQKERWSRAKCPDLEWQPHQVGARFFAYYSALDRLDAVALLGDPADFRSECFSALCGTEWRSWDEGADRTRGSRLETALQILRFWGNRQDSKADQLKAAFESPYVLWLALRELLA